IGTFLPTLYLIPEIGTSYTFLFFSGLLFFVAFIGYWGEAKAKSLAYLLMPIVIAILAFFLLRGGFRAPVEGQTMLFEDESAYNYIQVQEDANGYRYLYLNEGQGIHSQWHPTNIYYRRTWDFFLAAPYFTEDFTPNDMHSFLVIGLATGT